MTCTGSQASVTAVWAASGVQDNSRHWRWPPELMQVLPAACELGGRSSYCGPTRVLTCFPAVIPCLSGRPRLLPGLSQVWCTAPSPLSRVWPLKPEPRFPALTYPTGEWTAVLAGACQLALTLLEGLSLFCAHCTCCCPGLPGSEALCPC